MHSLDEFARTKLAALEAQSLRRELMATDRVSATEVMRHGHRLVSFSCNDYLGLAHDPRVKAAAAAAVALRGRRGCIAACERQPSVAAAA
jgi:8-amino-7-oxononanoate synthase